MLWHELWRCSSKGYIVHKHDDWSWLVFCPALFWMLKNMCQGHAKYSRMSCNSWEQPLLQEHIRSLCNTHEGQDLLRWANLYVGFAKRKRVSHFSPSPGNCKAGNQPSGASWGARGAAPAASDLSDNTHANKLKSNKFNDFDTIYGFKSN